MLVLALTCSLHEEEKAKRLVAAQDKEVTSAAVTLEQAVRLVFNTYKANL